MAYIGNKPTVGNFQICDAISVVNGQAAYTMQVGSVNVIPQSANHMIVSLNGTIQKPNSSYTVNSSVITFSSNLVTNDVIDFIQILGDVLDLGVPSDATVTTAKLADDAVTAAKITDATITAAKLASGTVQNQSAFKNIIINGDMSQAQRGTSETGITGAGYKTLDRFRLGGTVPGAWTWSQSTTVPTGQGFATSMKLECTTAEGSLASGDSMYFQHKIEGQNLQYLKKGTSSAESTTISFWVRSAKTGTYIVMLYDNDNNRHISKSYTISSADTWEKKTITYAGDTTGAFDNDNNKSLEIWIWLVAGANASSGTLATSWESFTAANQAVGQVNLADSTSNDFYITGVQLEVGSAASDFEFLPVDVNLKRCQRYYETDFTFFSIVCSDATNRAIGHCRFMTPKRANPTVGQVSGSSADIDFAFAGNSSFNTAFESSSIEGFRVYGDSLNPTRTIGFNGYWKHSNAKIKADSEL